MQILLFQKLSVFLCIQANPAMNVERKEKELGPHTRVSNVWNQKDILKMKNACLQWYYHKNDTRAKRKINMINYGETTYLKIKNFKTPENSTLPNDGEDLLNGGEAQKICPIVTLEEGELFGFAHFTEVAVEITVDVRFERLFLDLMAGCGEFRNVENSLDETSSGAVDELASFWCELIEDTISIFINFLLQLAANLLHTQSFRLYQHHFAPRLCTLFEL